MTTGEMTAQAAGQTVIDERKAPPAAVVIFGASGDLTARKLGPAVENLARHKRIPADARRAYRICSFLAGRTIEGAAITDGNSFDRARAKTAFLSAAIVNSQMILKLAELVVGIAIVRKRGPAPADRLI